jgi:hypothetical protein
VADINTFLTRFLYRRLPKADFGGPVVVLDRSTTQAATGANTTATDLYSYTMQANTLGTNGEAVRIIASGTTAANANNKRIDIKFGGTIVSGNDFTTSGDAWHLEATVYRTGAATQVADGVALRSSNIMDIRTATPTIDLTAAVAITVVGTNTVASANDIVLRTARVELL